MSSQSIFYYLLNLIEYCFPQKECKTNKTLTQVIEELQGQHELAMEKITQLESIITQQSVDMVSKNKRSNAQIERIFTRQQCSEEKTRKARAAV